MIAKEYLDLFSNHGPLKALVKFKDHDGSVPERHLEARELDKLWCREDGLLLQFMTFDDWLFEITKYEIDPRRGLITIHAQKTSETADGGQ